MPFGLLAGFAATTSATGSEWWITDGTTAGTRLLKDIQPGTAGSALAAGMASGGTAFVSAMDTTAGVELWRTTGTTASTERVADLAPGALNSSPAGLVQVGGLIYLRADDGARGSELWAMRAPAWPRIAVAASAVTPVRTKSTTLSITGADDLYDAQALIYTWTPVGTQPGSVFVQPNGVPEAKTAVVTFGAVGTYRMQCSVTNSAGHATSSNTVDIIVEPAFSAISVEPSAVDVPVQGSRRITAVARDQFGAPLVVQPSWAWTGITTGSIAPDGTYTAGTALTSITAVPSATVGSVTLSGAVGTSSSCSITITSATAPQITAGPAYSPQLMTGVKAG